MLPDRPCPSCGLPLAAAIAQGAGGHPKQWLRRFRCQSCGYRDEEDWEPIGNQSGYLVVETFAALYRKHAARYNNTMDIYAIPRLDREPEDFRVRYRGLDREALGPLSPGTERQAARRGEPYLLAEVRLNELDELGLLSDGYLASLADALDAYGWLGEAESSHEVIWTRVAGSEIPVPEGFVTIGFEPTYFTGSQFSASCDCMMFPRWHGTDEAGVLFREHFLKLNDHGLFDNALQAEEFLDYYLSLDWTEAGTYRIAEVLVRTT